MENIEMIPDCTEEELQHWGIKGMKWGIRRYQNKDGSLTPAGKKRYDDETDNDTETTEQKRERILKSTNAKEIYENRHLLSTNELNERINRIDTEARLQSKIPTEQTKTGNDRMRDAKQTLDNMTNLYKSVDNAYSSVVNSAIGKTLAKKLGLDVPKKEFNAEEFLANINKKTTQEVMDFSKRMTAEKLGRKTLKELQDADKAEKEAKEAEERAKKNLEEAQKQVDDYNKSGYKDDKVGNSSSTYSKTADDLTDNKTAYGASKKVAGLLGEAPEKVSGTVEGKGTSKFEGWKNNDVVIDAEYTEVEISNIPKDTVALGQRTVAGLLEMNHSDLDELAHFGIKGMKWGVRRFQNKNGSLTPAGKKRYDDSDDNISANKSTAKTVKASGRLSAKDTENELSEIVKEANNGNVKRWLEVEKKIKTKCGDWYEGKWRSDACKKISAEIKQAEDEIRTSRESMRKMLKDVTGKDYFFELTQRDEKKLATNRDYQELKTKHEESKRKHARLQSDRIGVILTEIGYSDTKTARDLIVDYVYWD